MCFKSSHNVFKTRKSDFLLSFTLQSLDLKRISNSIYSECYKETKSKNTPYDPSSLLRLFWIFNLYFKDNRFFRDADIRNIPDPFLLLCGFNLDSENIPSHSTYYYFLKRIGYNRQSYYLNFLKVMIMKFQFRLFTCRFTKTHGRFLVFAVDSKPVEIEGNVPKGTIRSNNKRLDGKLGFKIHSISIVYPFFFPIVFKFTPGHYSDSTVFKELFPLLDPLFEELKIQHILSFVMGDAGYDGLENISLITRADSIPCIAENKRNSSECNDFSQDKILFFQNDKLFCIYNPDNPLHSNGSEYKYHRRQFKCYHCKSCPFNTKCSKRFWLNHRPDNLLNEALLAAKMRLDIRASKLFSQIYNFRLRIETIHAIWNNAFMLENKFYFHNFRELFRFQMKIVSYSFHHFFYNSKSSILNYFY